MEEKKRKVKQSELKINNGKSNNIVIHKPKDLSQKKDVDRLERAPINTESFTIVIKVISGASREITNISPIGVTIEAK